jgi:antitoxin component YwqK of YwqJK toxin-antitoxin module
LNNFPEPLVISIKTEGFLVDGEINHTKTNFRQSGKLSQISKFTDGEIITTTSYDNNGKKEFELD